MNALQLSAVQYTQPFTTTLIINSYCDKGDLADFAKCYFKHDELNTYSQVDLQEKHEDKCKLKWEHLFMDAICKLFASWEPFKNTLPAEPLWKSVPGCQSGTEVTDISLSVASVLLNPRRMQFHRVMLIFRERCRWCLKLYRLKMTHSRLVMECLRVVCLPTHGSGTCAQSVLTEVWTM